MSPEWYRSSFSSLSTQCGGSVVSCINSSKNDASKSLHVVIIQMYHLQAYVEPLPLSNCNSTSVLWAYCLYQCVVACKYISTVCKRCCTNNRIDYRKIIYRQYLLPGAYELPKVVKELVTRCHHNSNYATHFQKFSEFFWYGFNDEVIILSIHGNFQQ